MVQPAKTSRGISHPIMPFLSPRPTEAFMLLVAQLSAARLVPFWVAMMTGILHASLCGRSVFLFSVGHGWLAGPWLSPLLG